MSANFKGNKNNKSFTLIELLVVIATIGLLASIVLVSLKGGREKAQLAKTLQWARSVKAQLGGDIVGDWNFNEGQGTTAYSATGYNNGTLQGGVSWTDGVQGLTGKALQFNGSTHYVSVPYSTSLKIDDKSFTLEAWIKPAANIPTGGRYTVMAFYTPGWLMDLPDDGNVEKYRFYNGATVYEYTPPGNLISLEWTHFLITRDLTTNKLRIYLNGALKQTWDITSVTASTNPLLIGRRTDGLYFNGTIDEVRIYNRALTAMEIQKHYADEAERHGLVLK